VTKNKGEKGEQLKKYRKPACDLLAHLTSNRTLMDKRCSRFSNSARAEFKLSYSLPSFSKVKGRGILSFHRGPAFSYITLTVHRCLSSVALAVLYYPFHGSHLLPIYTTANRNYLPGKAKWSVHGKLRRVSSDECFSVHPLLLL
jgi:hypothetical protein